MIRRHVVLLTYGEPPRADFFAQLRYSWRILRGLTRSIADIPALLLPVIALSRARARVAMWRSEAFESPLEPLTHAQRDRLAAALARSAPEVEWHVHVAYEFRDPLLADFVAGLPADEPVAVVPMYVADSAFTHQLARETLDAWQRRAGARRSPLRVLPPLPTETLAAVSAAHIRRELAARGVRPGPDWALVLAAHGTLLAPPRPYETGRTATEALAREIERELAGQFGRVTLGWLNHVYGGRWTEPPADEALRQVAAAGFTKVAYYPFGFLADNAESLLEGRQALRAGPGLESVHLPCLNAEAGFIEALAAEIVADEPATRAPALERPALETQARERSAAAIPAVSRRERRLDELQPGQRSIILRLEGDHHVMRRLMELGLVPGTPVEVVRAAPLGDPVELRVREVNLSLRRSETTNIHVRDH